MANMKCRALNKEEVEIIAKAILEGMVRADGTRLKPNRTIYTALLLQGNLGLRISDVLALRLSDIVCEVGRYHLNIVEKKTKKLRTFTVSKDIFVWLQGYCLDMGIGPNQKLFDITTRAVQMHLRKVCDELHIEGGKNISTHSFRKFFAVSIYNNSGYNIELVRELLQHSSTSVTQHYLSIDSSVVLKALEDHLVLV